MESERANLDCQIQMQQESVKIKEAEMKKIREEIEQVKLRFSQNSPPRSSDVCTFCGF